MLRRAEAPVIPTRGSAFRQSSQVSDVGVVGVDVDVDVDGVVIVLVHDVVVVHDVVTVQLEKLHVTVLQAMTLQVAMVPQPEPPQAGAHSSTLVELPALPPSPWPKGSLPQFTNTVAAPTAVKLKRIARRSVFIGYRTVCLAPMGPP